MSGEELEAEAASWVAREDRGLAAEEQAALTAWLEQSSLHRVTYLRLRTAWRRADRLAALKRPARHEADAATGWRGWRIGAAVAAVALLAVLGGGLYLNARAPYPPQTQQSYATGVGQRQDVQLADGTRIELNTNTRVRTQITGTLRTVTLDAGEAYFDVVHDAQRPFVVYAGNRRITDLGTKFSVFRDGDDVRVVVKEGRVQVDILGAPAPAAPVTAEGGRVVIGRQAETLVVAEPPSNIANDLSWRSGMLVFDQQTLAEVADQFNRYNVRQIVVEGSARKIRIGGSFRADNVGVFALLIRKGFGLSVNDQGEEIVVSRPK